jgi:hypothetical protein
MKKSRLLGALCASVITFVTLSVNAALVGRDLDGNLTTAEAYYDDEANLTWLANANAAVGSAYDTYSPGSGRMNWWDADAWAAGLDVDGTPGPDGWRLPTTDPAVSGVNTSGSEMGNMFYNVLGGTAYSSITTTHNSNYDLFSNVQSYFYWSSTESDSANAWDFNFSIGGQSGSGKTNNHLNAWAVQSGDVGAAVVSVPPALWLFGSGLLGLIGIAYNKGA